jgi:uncharacterized glyoxalase superfamily protein PhnB
MTYKPENYPSLAPYMVAPDAIRLIKFLEQAFDGKVTRRFDAPDGTVMHAEVRIDDSIVMLGQAGGEWKPVANWVHLYVKDVDASYKRALTAGAISVKEPTQREGDIDKRGGVQDQDGNTWWIATQQN